MEKLYNIDRDMCVTGNFYRFNNTADTTTLQSYDKYAAQDIARAYVLIEALKQYRLDIFSHFQKVSESASHIELHYKRVKGWNTKRVEYFVQIIRVYEDENIKPKTEFNRRFAGTERREAKAMFEQLKKEYPGIKYIVDIEKKSWEK
jgi:hypothetical protein